MRTGGNSDSMPAPTIAMLTWRSWHGFHVLTSDGTLQCWGWGWGGGGRLGLSPDTAQVSRGLGRVGGGGGGATVQTTRSRVHCVISRGL